MDLYFSVAIFLAVFLKDWGIKVICIRLCNDSLGSIIMAFVVVILVGVPVK